MNIHEQIQGAYINLAEARQRIEQAREELLKAQHNRDVAYNHALLETVKKNDPQRKADAHMHCVGTGAEEALTTAKIQMEIAQSVYDQCEMSVKSLRLRVRLVEAEAAINRGHEDGH